MSSSESLNPDAYYVTKDGFKKLEDDLAELKNQRPAIAESLRVAMQDKDLEKMHHLMLLAMHRHI